MTDLSLDDLLKLGRKAAVCSVLIGDLGDTDDPIHPKQIINRLCDEIECARALLAELGIGEG